MSLLFWKKNKIIDSFASELASELYSNLQPQIAKQFFEGASDNKQMKKNEKKIRNEIQGVIKKINEFKFINSLGVYGKARLHLKLKLRLEELGYEQQIANKLNEIVMVKTP